MENYHDIITEDMLPPKRSSFLTILCVLSFAGSMIGIFTGLITISNGVQIATETGSSRMDSTIIQEKKRRLEKHDNAGSRLALSMMDASVELRNEKKSTTSAGAGIIANLLTLSGAVLMWRLNRKGFYFYVTGIVMTIATPLFVYGTHSVLAVITAAYYGFFGLLFIALYAFNLKDMQSKPLLS